MKSVAKVFIIISAVVYGISAFVMLILAIVYGITFDTLVNNLVNQGYNQDIASTSVQLTIILFSVMFVLCLISLVLSIVCFKKLNNAIGKKGMVAWGVVTLLFVNLISGILMLCMDDIDYAR